MQKVLGRDLTFVLARAGTRQEEKREERPQVAPSVSTTRDARNSMVWVPGGSGRF